LISIDSTRLVVVIASDLFEEQVSGAVGGEEDEDECDEILIGQHAGRDIGETQIDEDTADEACPCHVDAATVNGDGLASFWSIQA
jgi:hypothetical protein